MKVQMVGRVCPECDKFYEMTRKVLQERGLPEEIERITETKDIINRFGVIHVPALVVDGKVILSGAAPSEQKLNKAFSKIKSLSTH